MGVKTSVGPAMAAGQISVCRIWFDRRDARKKQRQVDFLFSRPNQIQMDWGAIITKCVGDGDKRYRINAMYLEFENVTDPEDEIAAPTYERSEGQDYYQNLAFSGTRDFLRVPLLLNPGISVAPGYEDIFQEGVGNRMTFYAQSQGSVGVHGKTFSDSVNSKIYGVSLVSTPEFGDTSKDLIFSRSYFAADEQVVKLPASQIGVTWDITLQ